MRRRIIVILAALLLAVVIGDEVAWHFAVDQLRTGLAARVAERRAAGWSVETGTPVSGGWPFAATLTLRDAAVRAGPPDLPNSLAWRAERTVLKIALFRPQLLQVELFGAQHFRLDHSPDVSLTAGRFELLAPLLADPSAQPLDLHAEALHATAGDANDALTAERLDAHAVWTPAAPEGQAALSLSSDASGIVLPPGVKWALGPHVASLALDAALNGPLPAANGLASAAAAWRDAGGSLEVRRLNTQWGPLGLDATATLALDSELQPMGTGTARAAGYAETLDALAHSGLMTRSAATTAKAVLSLLADTPGGDGAPQVEVPLSLQYRTLSMRQVPLVRLPELDWPTR